VSTAAELVAQSDHDQVIIGLGVVVTMLATSLVYLIRTYGQARQANSAVNHVEFGEARLFDRVIHIQEEVAKLVEANNEFQSKGWATLPDEFGNAAALSMFLMELKHGQERIERMLIKHIEETTGK